MITQVGADCRSGWEPDPLLRSQPLGPRKPSQPGSLKGPDPESWGSPARGSVRGELKTPLTADDSLSYQQLSRAVDR